MYRDRAGCCRRRRRRCCCYSVINRRPSSTPVTHATHQQLAGALAVLTGGRWERKPRWRRPVVAWMSTSNCRILGDHVDDVASIASALVHSVAVDAVIRTVGRSAGDLPRSLTENWPATGSPAIWTYGTADRRPLLADSCWQYDRLLPSASNSSSSVQTEPVVLLAPSK